MGAERRRGREGGGSKHVYKWMKEVKIVRK